MTALRSLLLGLASASLLAVAPCASPLLDRPAARGGTGEETAATLRVGGTATLRLGESVRVEGTAVRLRFVRVVEDSRCPLGVTCVWAGRARVEIGVNDGGPARSLELEVAHREPTLLPERGLGLSATALDPYPQAEAPPDPDAARLLLRVLASPRDGA
jgi:hypothetical protein